MKNKNLILWIIMVIVIGFLGTNIYLYFWKTTTQQAPINTQGITTNMSGNIGGNENWGNIQWIQDTVISEPVKELSKDERIAECQQIVSTGKVSDDLAATQFYKDYLHAINLTQEEINSYVKVLSTQNCSSIEKENQFFCEKLQGTLGDLKIEDFKEDPYPYYLIKSIISSTDYCAELETEWQRADCSYTFYVFDAIKTSLDTSGTVDFDFGKYNTYIREDFLKKCKL